MATIIANANGDWHTGATWIGSVVPTASDDVQLAGKTITWTAGTAIDALTITSVGTAGQITRTMASTTNYALNCSGGLTAGTGPLLEVSGSGTGMLTITGDLTGGTGGNDYCCRNTSTGDVTIIGDVDGGSGGSGANYGCYNTSTGSFTITGDVTGGSVGSNYGCRNDSSGDFIINGDLSGGAGGDAVGCRNTSTGTITVNGTVTGGTGGNAFGVKADGTGAVTINNGNVINSDYVALSGRGVFDINMGADNFYQMKDGTKFFPQEKLDFDVNAARSRYRPRYNP